MFCLSGFIHFDRIGEKPCAEHHELNSRFGSRQIKHKTRPEERGGSVVECRTPEREVRGSKPTAAVLCPWARHFTPRKYWLITQEAMAPSRHDWKIVDWDVKPQHNQQNQTTLKIRTPPKIAVIILKFEHCSCTK